jgi:arsenate reductase
VNYYTAPLSREKLAELLKKMKLAPRDILRKSEAVYRELQLASRTLTDDELISVMVEHPDLIQRPIIERGERAVLGRPVENIKELL